MADTAADRLQAVSVRDSTEGNGVGADSLDLATSQQESHVDTEIMDAKMNGKDTSFVAMEHCKDSLICDSTNNGDLLSDNVSNVQAEAHSADVLIDFGQPSTNETAFDSVKRSQSNFADEQSLDIVSRDDKNSSFTENDLLSQANVDPFGTVDAQNTTSEIPCDDNLLVYETENSSAFDEHAFNNIPSDAVNDVQAMNGHDSQSNVVDLNSDSSNLIGLGIDQSETTIAEQVSRREDLPDVLMSQGNDLIGMTQSPPDVTSVECSPPMESQPDYNVNQGQTLLDFGEDAFSSHPQTSPDHDLSVDQLESPYDPSKSHENNGSDQQTIMEEEDENIENDYHPDDDSVHGDNRITPCSSDVKDSEIQQVASLLKEVTIPSSSPVKEESPPSPTSSPEKQQKSSPPSSSPVKQQKSSTPSSSPVKQQKPTSPSKKSGVPIRNKGNAQDDTSKSKSTTASSPVKKTAPRLTNTKTTPGNKKKDGASSDSGVEEEKGTKKGSADVKKKTASPAKPAPRTQSATSSSRPQFTTSSRPQSTTSSRPQSSTGSPRPSSGKPSLSKSQSTASSAAPKLTKSKVGSLDNANHSPSGGNVKILQKKTEYTSVQSRIGSKEKMEHKPGGGNVKIETKRLNFSETSKSKVRSLDNATRKAGGGTKKIESRKLEWKAESRIGSMDNAKHKPGGGEKQIESKKLDWKVNSRVGSLENAKHKAGGGDKSIVSEKLNWTTTSKIGSLENAFHSPGGGNVKIESHKLDFKEKAQSKVGSKNNMEHTPRGGEKKIETHKLEFKEKAESKVGSKDNMKHTAGGGDKKIETETLTFKQNAAARTDSGKTSLDAGSSVDPEVLEGEQSNP